MKSQSIKKNYLYNMMYQCAVFLIPVITAPYLARVFGAEKIGIFSYTNSLASYFILLGALGTTTYGQREVANARDDKIKLSYIFWEIELLKVFFTILALAGWLLYINMSKQYIEYFVCFAIYIIASAFDISWFFQGNENFKIVVFRNLIIKFAGIIFLFTCIKRSSQLGLYIFILGMTEFFGNLSMWRGLKKYLVSVNVKEINMFKHLKDVVVYFVPTIATSVYTVLDKTMIGWITGDMAENGYYEQANKIINIGKAVCDSFLIVMTTRMSYLYTHNYQKQMKEYFDKAIQYVLFVSILMTAGIISIAYNMVPWYLGAGFEKVEVLLYVEASLIIIVGLSNAMGRLYLTPSGQRGRSSKAIVIGSILNIILNSLWIPKWGAIGASFASVITEMVITSIYIYMSKEFVQWGKLWNYMWKKLIAAVVVIIILTRFNPRFCGNIIISFVQIAIGILVYGIVLLLEKDDSLVMILNLLGGKSKKHESK